VPYGSGESTYLQRWRQTPNFRSLNRYNSTVDCSISLKCTMEFDCVTPIHYNRSRSKSHRWRWQRDVTYQQ